MAKQEYVVERSIALTGEESRAARHVFRMRGKVVDFVSQMIVAVSEELVDREDHCWDGLAQKAGFDGLKAMHAAGRSLSIDHGAGLLYVERLASEPEAKKEPGQ